MLTIVLLIIFGVLIYFQIIRPCKYWKNKNVKTTKVNPLFGENFWTIFGFESFPEQMLRLYNNFPDERYFGFYQFTRPILLLRTPELIKQLYVKDSDYFMNRQTFVPDNADDLFSKNLIALKGEEWKNMRSTLSPTFTISKMKAMFTFISHNADQFVNYFLEMNKEIVEVEFTDAMSRFTNDVIAGSAYGLQVDSLKDRHNTFYEMGRRATHFEGFKTKFAIYMYLMLPKIAAFLGLTIIEREVQSFFVNLVKDTIEMRRKRNIKRADVIGVMMEAQEKEVHEKKREDEKGGFAVVDEHLEVNETKQNLNYKDIAAHTFLFFVAGFEGISNLLCYISYELALHPDIQKRLMDEVDEICPHGEPSYGEIMNMEYLDMVVCETLRKWPSGLETERVATKKYTIQPEKPGEEALTLEPESVVMISILGLHYDPKYFNNPQKFDPERFSPENRKNINPYAYIPFGIGIRNCVGSRFAIMEVKILIFKILCHFEIVPVERTQIPLKFNKEAFRFIPTDGFHLGLQRRI